MFDTNKDMFLAIGGLVVLGCGIGIGSVWRNRRPTPQAEDFHYALDKVKKYYNLHRELLPGPVDKVWVQSNLDVETIDWLEDKTSKGFWSNFYMHHAMTVLLKFGFSKTDCGGILNRDMYVFSKDQLRSLLPKGFKPKLIMDVGAGSGTIAEKAREVLGVEAENTYAIEVSGPMIDVLEQRGFRTVTVESFNNPYYALKFDFLMCLNVIDRVDDPKMLLKTLSQRLAPDGLLLIAIVLPYCDGVEHGPKLVKPARPLTEMNGFDCKSKSNLEASLRRFIMHVLPDYNLEPVSVTKVPYLSSGDLYQSWYTLPDVLMVLKKGTGGMKGVAGAIGGPEEVRPEL